MDEVAEVAFLLCHKLDALVDSTEIAAASLVEIEIHVSDVWIVLVADVPFVLFDDGLFAVLAHC